MTWIVVHKRVLVASVGAFIAASAGSALAESAAVPTDMARSAKTQSDDRNAKPPLAIVQGNKFDVFAPGADPIEHTIDYSIWDHALSQTVISMGPSIRKSIGRSEPTTGTRRRYGVESRYRLEGSMMMFSFFDKDVIDSFGEYRRDLEATADLVDIQSLSRNEQLAYWFNLHNVAMVEQIASNWPMRQPRKFKIDGVLLDDVKFITVKGVKLSLRDIREEIVFKHWKDPKVIYGFWRGEIGGPALQRDAYNARNVSGVLDRAAQEFVNSLRGTQKRGDRLDVSEIYAEAAPFFFSDFESDIRSHIEKYAGEDVLGIMAKTTRTTAGIREYDIADLAGGAREPSYTNLVDANTGQPISFRIPTQMASLLRLRTRKFEWMVRNGIPTGTVTFSNLDLPGQETSKEQVD
ncbi:MAG: DUF547 domain-containing protein [Pseudomonadota bacterium]